MTDPHETDLQYQDFPCALSHSVEELFCGYGSTEKPVVCL